MKIKLLIWILALIPLSYLIYRLFFDLPTDPIKFISDITGITALQFLIATLTVSPIRTVTKINLIKHRRLLGLITFFYALGHMFLYLLLDHDLSFTSLLQEAADKKFIFFGMASFLILFFMALTSTKQRFRRFVKWHQFVYLAAVFIIVHYLLSQKIITLTPLIYTAIILLLLLFRFKKIKRLLFRR